MRQLIVRRMLLAIPLLFVVSFLSFALVAVAPGDPAVDILGLNATKAQDASLDRQLGFDQPVPVQYWHWLVNALHGDLGTSFTSSQPVKADITASTGTYATLQTELFSRKYDTLVMPSKAAYLQQLNHEMNEQAWFVPIALALSMPVTGKN
jgi:ABC-type dipeptide/oligopeptide/nickel transport system permease component